MKLLIAATWAVLSLSQVTSITVDIPGQGTVLGSETEGAFTGRRIYQFRGLNFAEPPSGFRRFKAPVPALPWTGTRDATETGRDCPTFANTINNRNVDNMTTTDEDIEDCLHLSVYSTDLSARRPVMVYFHGGGFYEGAAHHHPPNYLLEEDVVLVVPQYRLGPLGFLSTMTADIPGNAAMLDTVLALRWVQQYITSFGGDPNRVTIFGQSAGAGIVSALILSPAVPDGLFHGAIMQSGSAFGSWVVDEQPVLNSRDIARLGGCHENGTLIEINACLMAMDVRTLMAAFTAHKAMASITGIHMVGGCRITVGGPSNFMPHSPYKLMRTGGGRRDIPVMAGVTKHDGTFSLAGLYEILDKTVGINDTRFNAFQLIDTLNQVMGVDEYTNSLAGYEVASLFTNSPAMVDGDFMEMIDALVDISSVLVIKGPTFRAAQAHAYHSPQQTYLYSFDYRGEFTRFGYGADTSHYPFEGGIHHSNDNIYIYPWPEFVSNLNPADTEMAKRMVSFWATFATTGIPSAPGTVEWPTMTRVNGPYLHIDTTPSVGQNFYEEYTVTVRDGLNDHSLRRRRSGN